MAAGSGETGFSWNFVDKILVKKLGFRRLSSQTVSEGFSLEDDWLKLLVSQSMDVM